LVVVLASVATAAWLPGGAAVRRPSRPVSWSTLPVFFHGANHSGPWSHAAVAQIARFPMANMEKDPGPHTQSAEVGGPLGCRQIQARNTSTDAFFYLNSVIDWPFNFKLHALMAANPSWRLKNTSGSDIVGLGQWLYNLTNDAMRAAWVAECVTAAVAGCTGCFIDQANVLEGIATWPPTSPVVVAYRKAHLAAFAELEVALAPLEGYSVRCSFFDRCLRTRMLLSCTRLLRLKRACV
jgi:hypothetical protein